MPPWGFPPTNIDPSAVPVKHAPRRVPIPMRKKLKDKLKELESMDIIVKETESTSWINSMVGSRDAKRKKYSALIQGLKQCP